MKPTPDWFETFHCPGRCDVCGIDRMEFFMLRDDVWQWGDDWLCIGCVEAALGRQLNKRDFTDCPANDPRRRLISKRMRSRLNAAKS